LRLDFPCRTNKKTHLNSQSSLFGNNMAKKDIKKKKMEEGLGRKRYLEYELI
jgi:hypothetical protein